MTKNKFIFNIDGKEVVKEPKEALKMLKKDCEDIQKICIDTTENLLTGIQLLNVIEGLIEAAKEDIKNSKKTAVVSKKGTKPSKVEKPAKKVVKANPVKKAKKVIKSKRKAK
ncbi:MAG: hypothetical protein UHK60_09020 [Acutalibacteraceae bacterium]|nr:hypothetical protein [Acutalibacteraceae bacterium]